jgi:hypothetical protein
MRFRCALAWSFWHACYCRPLPSSLTHPADTSCKRSHILTQDADLRTDQPSRANASLWYTHSKTWEDPRAPVRQTKHAPTRLKLIVVLQKFAAHDTLPIRFPQVFFLRSAPVTDYLVLELPYSSFAPTAAGEDSSTFGVAAVRRVLGVSRLNCLILYRSAL